MDPHAHTAFGTYSGLCEFQKMPFRLVNALATFQRLMEVVLHGLDLELCLPSVKTMVLLHMQVELSNHTRKVWSD